MPQLDGDFLRHNFAGSSFVWKNFKNNPALSVFGLPLLAVDTALLPLRVLLALKDSDWDDEGELERLRRKQGMPGSWQYAQYTGGHQPDRASRKKAKKEKLTYSSSEFPPPEVLGASDGKSNSKRSSRVRDPSLATGNIWEYDTGYAASSGPQRAEGSTVYYYGSPESSRSELSADRSHCALTARTSAPSEAGLSQASTATSSRYFSSNGSSSRHTVGSRDGEASMGAGRFETGTSRLSETTARPPVSRTAASLSEGSETHDEGMRFAHRSSPRLSRASRSDSQGYTNEHDDSASNATWAPSVSSIHTLQTFEPTLDMESIQPWDSLSQRGGSPTPWQGRPEGTHFAHVPGRNSRRKPGSSRATRPSAIEEDYEREEEDYEQNVRTPSVTSRRSQPGRAVTASSNRPYIDIHEPATGSQHASRDSRKSQNSRATTAASRRSNPSTIDTASLADTRELSSQGRAVRQADEEARYGRLRPGVEAALGHDWDGHIAE